ncbi:hypothetical protein FE391_43170 [Nonomuraea sp. KC401]|uniref:hypothetical protein n=1 Tax=unclassified Nonomuraea TaxID=2593643 RepID=UPI0010FE5729|nr:MULTISPECIES: hypothetical protein [unclassified Nonomuraea]NBF00194.1 hypothetical protein [Nonomuraea sp. K271]TLF52935.1 hypothetical protein FE391_43170 [Nonomuraea sp. KC401]
MATADVLCALVAVIGDSVLTRPHRADHVLPAAGVYFAALVLGTQTAMEPPEQAVFVLAAFAASAGWQPLSTEPRAVFSPRPGRRRSRWP